MLFNRKKKETEGFNGIVTFYNSFNAMKAEKSARKNLINCKLVHSPRDLSPTCGVALAFNYSENEKLKTLLSDENVNYDGVHEYSQ